MSLKLDKILVIDIEATCWDSQAPEGQFSEIIEIGLCVLETHTGERMAQESLLIKPTVSKVSFFCTQLTTLTQSQVDQGLSLREACKILRKKYSSQDYTWASYGDYDRRQFERECQEKEITYPFGSTHINVKNLLAITQRWERERGMASALEKLGLPLEGTHHRGGDDAWNVANILRWILESSYRK